MLGLRVRINMGLCVTSSIYAKNDWPMICMKAHMINDLGGREDNVAAKQGEAPDDMLVRAIPQIIYCLLASKCLVRALVALHLLGFSGTRVKFGTTFSSW